MEAWFAIGVDESGVCGTYGAEMIVFGTRFHGDGLYGVTVLIINNKDVVVATTGRRDKISGHVGVEFA